MKVVIDRKELEDIVRSHLMNTISSLKLSKENTYVDYVDLSSGQRLLVDQVEVEIIERY